MTKTIHHSPPRTPTRNGARDFDFLLGRWLIRNRRLMQRLAGSQEWQEFAASCDVHPLPADIGNRDEYRTGFWPGFVGLSFRFYNPETRLWSIYWTDSRKRLAVLEPPVVGAFVDGVGVFETRDEFEGRAIVVRYTWTRTDTETPHWEQAFSPDDGLTWEVNWVMAMERAAS